MRFDDPPKVAFDERIDLSATRFVRFNGVKEALIFSEKKIVNRMTAFGRHTRKRLLRSAETSFYKGPSLDKLVPVELSESLMTIS